MGFQRLFFYTCFALVLAVGFAYFTKREDKTQVVVSEQVKAEIAKPKEAIKKIEKEQESKENQRQQEVCEDTTVKVDKIRHFFSKGFDKFPIVETITYSSRVPWLKGRAAWIADYASHYSTSRHFIARSLNGRPDYITQNVSPGDKFNVLKPGKEVEFYLLVDLMRCTLDFYYLDLENDERVLVKTYEVGVGRKDDYSPSGSLTPTGKFKLGDKIAVYRPGIYHYFQNQKTHMIEVFGTRWLPFGEEVENCTDSAKGFGLHGLPCTYKEEDKQVAEEVDAIGGYNSDGCIRMKNADMEELFAIVVTKPTFVEIVKDKNQVTLPMSKEGKY